jgi:hypothetical protein
MSATEETPSGLQLLRKPFEPNQISQMCRSTKKDNPKGKCPKCGGWHGLPAIQLTYVGHAALTDRLLDADPAWSWEPLALDNHGHPAIDKDGGMWIWLTVCGVKRLGYGDAQGKSGGDAMKERIGDALRNAGMRFGAALELWHKGILHMEDDSEPQAAPAQKVEIDIAPYLAAMDAAKTPKELAAAAKAAWEATEDDRVVAHHQKILEAHKAAKKPSEAPKDTGEQPT